MARYTADSKERVREAVDMVDLVSAYTELRRAGANRWQGLCPFHEERTPSFGIDPVEKLYHCFGCGAGGDAFRFVEEKEGVDFKAALELLADRYGVEIQLEEEDRKATEERRQRTRLLELLERAATFYVRSLWESEEAAPAREYLVSRGLEEGTLREFRVGYAPSAYDRLLLASRRAGFANGELWEVGLAQRAKGEGRLYDRFRRRIMFPLCDPRGRVLGFGARAIGADQQPKYLNSADNTIYHKGRHVFGADLARVAAGKAGAVIVAEGYTDVIALHQAGLRNAVGLMGTALTEDQVGELGRLASVVHLALDADSAGHDAMIRAAKVAAQRQLDLRVIPLPPGSDPAELVKSQGEMAVRDLVDASMPWARFRVEQELGRGDLQSADGKDRVIRALVPVFETLERGALHDELLRLVANRTDLLPSVVSALVTPRTAAAGNGPGSSEAASGGRAGDSSARNEDASKRTRWLTLDAVGRSERTFLAMCIALPSGGRDALSRMDVASVFASDLTRRAAIHLRDHLDAPGAGLPEDDDELLAFIAELTVRARELATTPAALEAETLKLQLAHLDRQIATSRASGAGDVAGLAAHRTELKLAVDRAIGRAMGETPVGASPRD